jgi:hypothetical protein
MLFVENKNIEKCFLQTTFYSFFTICKKHFHIFVV